LKHRNPSPWLLILGVLSLAFGSFFLARAFFGLPNKETSVVLEGHTHRVTNTRTSSEAHSIPDFSLKPIDLPARNLSEWIPPQGILILNFWAEWCTSCLAEMPSLQSLQSAWKADQVRILLVNVDNDPKVAAEKMRKRLKIDLPIVTEENHSLSDWFDIHGIPFTAVIGQDRKVLFTLLGEQDWNSKAVHDQVKQWLSLKD
jgi:thiol-disulfide isomerase/thioredoxin